MIKYETQMTNLIWVFFIRNKMQLHKKTVTQCATVLIYLDFHSNLPKADEWVLQFRRYISIQIVLAILMLN